MAAIIAFITITITRRCQRKKLISRKQAIALVLLTTYIFLVFASTVFSRTATSQYTYELIPFWSYRKILQGSESLFWEDIFNVLMLLPVGIFVPIVITGGEKERLFFRVLRIGFLISFTIEILQLVMKRGLFEFDDMFHNTLGVAIGYWIIENL
jgi:glycopeptide antibiotics resistance protein